MKILALIFPLVALTLSHPLQAGVVYRGQLGLFDQNGGNEFTRNDGFQTSSRINTSSSTGITLGTSNRYNGGGTQLGGALWMATSLGATIRIGLYDQNGGNQFTSSTGIQNSTYKYFNFGITLGTSDRYNGGSTQLGTATWLATTAGAIVRLGFYDQNGGVQYTSSTGSQTSTLSHEVDTGYASGTSTIYNGGAASVGAAAWISSPAGITTRVGLYDQNGGNQFTSSSNAQNSSSNGIGRSGVSDGLSFIYNGGSTIKATAGWMATPDGVTTRVGLYDQNGGNEFTSSTGSQTTGFVLNSGVADTGAIIGTSNRYNGGSAGLGTAMWVATPALTTTRIGLYDQGGGNQFTRGDGYQTSSYVDSSGDFFFGNSARYIGSASSDNTAAWSASSLTGATVRLGLYDQNGGNEFTSNDGRQKSTIHDTSAHYADGTSTRYSGTASTTGTAAWFANNATGATTRIGLYDQGGGNQFTSSTGIQNSSPREVNDHYVIGTSTRYSGTASSTGTGIWVSAINVGTTTRIGFYDQGGGNEFTSSTGTQNSEFPLVPSIPTSSGNSYFTPGGLIAGDSYRYKGGSTQLGTAAWIANAATGVITRVGLTDSAHTAPNGSQESYVTLFNDNIVTGISYFYDSSSNAKGDDAWVKLNNAYTLLGYFPTTNGVSDSIDYLTQSGYIAGGSSLADGVLGNVAWLYDVANQKETSFDLSSRPSDGYIYSTISFLTESGITGGLFNLYDTNSNLVGSHHFVYIPGSGTYDVDTALAGLDWTAISTIASTDSGVITGNATYLNNGTSSQGVFLFQATVPEPSEIALLALGLGIAAFRMRRSRA